MLLLPCDQQLSKHTVHILLGGRGMSTLAGLVHSAQARQQDCTVVR